MIEGKFIVARAEAEKDIEPLLRVMRHALLEVYMIGFRKGLKSCEESEEALEKRLADEEDTLARFVQPFFDDAPDPHLNRPLNQEEFSRRTWRCLCKNRMETLGDLLKVKKTEYLKWSMFGHKSLKEIMEYVEQFGYELK